MKNSNIQHPLIYEKEYHVWVGDSYLGIATYTEDENIGDSFLIAAVQEGIGLVHNVIFPTHWELAQKTQKGDSNG